MRERDRLGEGGSGDNANPRGFQIVYAMIPTMTKYIAITITVISLYLYMILRFLFSMLAN